MTKLSIIGRGYHTEEHVVGYYNMGDRMKSWGKVGAFWGGIWGWLFGSAFFFIPGVGPLLFAGPIIGWIVGALEGAVVVGGLSALGAGLASMGIPENSILKYEAAMKADKYLLTAHGTAAEDLGMGWAVKGARSFLSLAVRDHTSAGGSCRKILEVGQLDKIDLTLDRPCSGR